MLGHRVFEPRWAALPTDPAIDQDKSSPERYAEIGFDYRRALKETYTREWLDGKGKKQSEECNVITLVDGMRPSQFKIAPLESRQRRIVASFNTDQESAVERADYMLRAGLLAVMDWQEQDAAGAIKNTEWTLDRKDYGRYGTCCSLDCAQNLPFHMNHVDMLAAMIWRVSETDPFVSPPSDQQSGAIEP